MPKKKGRMTIAFISMIREPWGGSEELWYETALYALEKGDTVIHSSFQCKQSHPKKDLLQKKGAKLFFRPGITEPNLPPLIRLIKLTWNYLKNKLRNPFTVVFQERPDIVVYTGTAYSIAFEKHLLPFLEKKNFKLFILVQLNNENDQYNDNKYKETVRKCYAISSKTFFVSEKNLRTAERHLDTRIANAFIVRNPVNLEIPSDLDFPDMSEETNMAMVGNLITVHKGQDLVLNVLGESAWKNRRFILNIYGKGLDENYLKQLTSNLGLQTKVVFHGHTENVRDIWKNNHILILPSHMEGMPLAVVEAMLCFRPVVATRVGGIPEWIEQGREGFLSNTATVESLRLAMELAWQRRSDWKEMGIQARRKAMQLYDPEAGKTFYELITSNK